MILWAVDNSPHSIFTFSFPRRRNRRNDQKNTLIEIAKILNVNFINFITMTPGCAEDSMQTFFWLDEDNRNTFHLFQLVRNPSKYNSDDNTVMTTCYQ